VVPASFVPLETELHESGWPPTLVVVWPAIWKSHGDLPLRRLELEVDDIRVPVECRSRRCGEQREQDGQRQRKSLGSHAAGSLARRNAAS
jgi:hypothetical protein